MTETTEYFVVINLQGKTIDSSLTLKIPEAWVNNLFDSESVTFDIIKRTNSENSILRKDTNLKIRIKSEP